MIPRLIEFDIVSRIASLSVNAIVLFFPVLAVRLVSESWLISA